MNRTLLAAVITVSTACGDSTGPAPIASIDEQAAIASVEPLTTVFDYPLFRSLDNGLAVAADIFGFRGVIVGDTRVSGGGSRLDERVLRSLVPTTLMLGNAIVGEAQGKTYVYSATLGRYVVDATATGAPAAGVRIVLYAWEETVSAPTMPLNRVGYVDFTPVAAPDASTDQLHARLVRDNGNLVFADYVVARRTITGGASFRINGWATDGTTTVFFDATNSATGTLGARLLAVDSDISAPALGTRVHLTASSDEAASKNNAELSLLYDGHTLAARIATAGSEVRLDGRLYATGTPISEPGTTVQYAKADGTPLTQEEVDDLNAMLEHEIGAVLQWSHLVWF